MQGCCVGCWLSNFSWGRHGYSRNIYTRYSTDQRHGSLQSMVRNYLPEHKWLKSSYQTNTIATPWKVTSLEVPVRLTDRWANMSFLSLVIAYCFYNLGVGRPCNSRKFLRLSFSQLPEIVLMILVVRLGVLQLASWVLWALINYFLDLTISPHVSRMIDLRAYCYTTQPLLKF